MSTRTTQPRTLFLSGRAASVLVSPMRLEIVEAFKDNRPRSARELAQELDRPVSSLYFHIHRLLRAGVIVECGRRPGVKKPEVLYRPTARRIGLATDPSSPASVETAVGAVRAILRRCEREFKAAVRSGAASDPSGRPRTAGRRMKSRLTDADLASFLRRLETLERWLVRRDNRAAGRPVVWTSFVVPVEPPKIASKTRILKTD